MDDSQLQQMLEVNVHSRSTLRPLLAMAFVLCIASGSPLTRGYPQIQSQTVVQTKLGPVHGRCTEHTCRWLNIPFAEKIERFARSRPRSEPYEAVGDATFGPACVQFIDMAEYMHMPMAPLPQSEDCLSLNVWSPTAPTGEQLPVMVWIHGGGFLSGSARDADLTGIAAYDGARLAAHGVIVVTLQYRLGVLGFLQQADRTGGANGIADQITALQWVQQHIEQFGGDSSRVTIFGESSGSVSVCALTHSPQAAGLFKRAISQSGACFPSLDLIASTADAARSRAVYLKRLSATDPSLRTMDVRKLVNRTLELFDFSDLFTTASPSVDGAILPDDPVNLDPLPVDAMIGITSYDNPEITKIANGAIRYFSRFLPSAQEILANYPPHTRDRDIVNDACIRYG